MKPKSKSSPAGESPRDENKNKNLGGLLRIRRRFRRAASPIPIAMTSRTVGKKTGETLETSVDPTPEAGDLLLFVFFVFGAFSFCEKEAQARRDVVQKKKPSRLAQSCGQFRRRRRRTARFAFYGQAERRRRPPATGPNRPGPSLGSPVRANLARAKFCYKFRVAGPTQPSRAKLWVAGPNSTEPGQVLLQV